MPYILISPDEAEPFSRALCRLMRPAHLRGPDYVTDFYCPVHAHPDPEYGWSALELPDSETVPIHMEATGSELLEEFTGFVQKGSLTVQEAQDIAAAVGSMKGVEVRIADFVPPSWADKVLTQQQMVDEGFFAKDSL